LERGSFSLRIAVLRKEKGTPLQSENGGGVLIHLEEEMASTRRMPEGRDTISD